MAKYHVSITIHKSSMSIYNHLGMVRMCHTLEVEADSEEQAEAKVRDLPVYETLDCTYYNITIEEVGDTYAQVKGEPK